MDSFVTEARACVQPVAFDAALAQRLAQLSPDLVYVYDMQAQRNVYANPRLSDILGLTPSTVQALGDTRFAQLLHLDDHSVRQASAERVLQTADGQYSAGCRRLR